MQRTSMPDAYPDTAQQFLLDELVNALQAAVLLVQHAEGESPDTTQEITGARHQLERAVSALKALRETPGP